MFTKLKQQIFNKKFLKEFLFINLGVICLAFSVIFVYDPNNVVFGGASTIGIILHNVAPKLATSFYIMIVNIIFLIMGGLLLGKEFFLKTIYGSLIYPVYAFGFEKIIKYANLNDELIKLYTDNKLLVIIMAAAIMGLGIGTVLKYGGSTGGTDNLEAIFLKYFNLPHSLSLIIIDGVIVLSGAFIIYPNDFQSIMTMIMYGTLTILISGFIIDNIVFNGFNVRSAYIITSKSNEVKQEIYKTLGRGVTEIYAKGGYYEENRMVLFCVLKTTEFYKLRSAILKIDSSAFIVVTKASEVHGEGFTFDLENPQLKKPIGEKDGESNKDCKDWKS